MDEVLPVLVGMVVGLLVAKLGASRSSLSLAVLAGSLGAGMSTWTSGEWAHSWLYVLGDAAEVAAAAALTSFCLSRSKFAEPPRRARA